MSDPNTTTLTATDEQAQFNDGARRGHILYCQASQGKILSPRDVYELLMTILLDTTHPSLWNASYIAGWFAALCRDERADNLFTGIRETPVLLQQLTTLIQRA